MYDSTGGSVMTVEAQKETLGFQTEVKQLLALMIHSLYSNKEVFLRELISNASDAVDRLRFAMLSDTSLHEDGTELKIRVSYDKDARTVMVSDNGIGMTRAEVIEHIGTIARSGTREFFQSLTGDQQKDAALIGQFGVGFYSAFVVADRVTLITRQAGVSADQGVCWESDGQGQYTLETVEKAGCGTDVILHLHKGEDELLDGHRLRSIIKKYSDHITVPIMMPKEEKDTHDDERVNEASALWSRSKSELKEEDYKEFYKHLTLDYDEPLTYVHSRMEGTHEYILLLYIPGHAPFDLWNRERRHGLKLYVRRVFIMDASEQLMPGYLRFVRGVVDSNDLPLNISREMLQQNRLVENMRASAVKKVLSMLSDLSTKEKEKYALFWKEFGRALKEGIAEDTSNRELLARLLRFASTHNDGEGQDVALEDYVARMKQGQEKIYFITAESYAAARNSPLLEIFKKRGVEVLLLSDPIDYLIGTELHEFNGLQFQSVAKGAIDLSKLEDEQEKEEQKKSADEAKDLIERLKKVLAEQVKDVHVTTRLTTSPACLVFGEYDMDPSLQRVLKAIGQAIPSTKPILEINPGHPIIQRIKNEQDEKRFSDWAYLLYDQSMLSMGEQLENPTRFVSRLNDLLAQL